jgi:hypothetical protein
MLCPDCNKEVELSRGDPQISRVRLNGTVIHATVEVGDLCGECGRLIQGVKTDVERDLKDVPALKNHLHHKRQVELLKALRIDEPAGYASVKITYGLTCDCDQLPMYEGTLLGSSKLVVQP